MSKVGYIIYRVVLQITNRLEGGVPKDPAVIKSWLETKGISSADVYQETVAEVGTDVAEAQEEAARKNWCGFKEDKEKGLFIEARQVKAAFKEAANVLRGLLGITAAKSKLAERVWVKSVDPKSPETIWLGQNETDGCEERVVHAMTRRGPISSIKRTDYVDHPSVEFLIEVLDDGLFKREVLEELLTYMGKNGLGANRSQGAGQFEVSSFELFKEGKSVAA